MLFQVNPPIWHRHRMYPRAYFALRAELAAVLVTPEHIHPSIGWILEQAQYATVAQPAPYNLSIPGPTISPFGKAQAALHEALHHRIGTAGFAKQTKHQLHRGPHFLIRVLNNAPLLVVGITYRQRETQFSFLGFVELATQQARAQKMKLGMGHGALQSEQQAVVKIGWVIATIFIDYQGLGEGAQLQQAMPIQVRARQTRG